MSRHLLKAQEEERKRISRELHDEAGQGLMVLRLHLGMLAHGTDPEISRKVEEAMEMLDRTIGDLRRLIARLSPRVLDELGLLAAIRKEARELSRSTGVKAHLDLPEHLEGVDHDVEVAVYRSVQEALNNIAKHAQAKEFLIRLDVEDGCIRVRVEDDGIGFKRNSGSAPGKSFGLVGMRERIAALAGSVRVQSREGRGTRVKVIVPATGAITHSKRAEIGGVAVDSTQPGLAGRNGKKKKDTRTAPVFSRSGKGDSPEHGWRSSA